MVIAKVCGVKRPEDAIIALDNGANLIGIILVPGRGRTVDVKTAKAIAHAVHTYRRTAITLPEPENESVWERRARLLEIDSHSSPMLVGVVQNQPLKDVLQLQRDIGLDVVQFHGNEPLEWCKEVPVLSFKRFTPNTPAFSEVLQLDAHHLPLIDGEIGGTGELVDWELLQQLHRSGGAFILAGGLNSDNAESAARVSGVIGVDVSGGVETDGSKDPAKIRAFLNKIKSPK